MAQAQKVRLPDHERHVLESRGVIPTPTVPKIDVITEACKQRKWELEITLSDAGHAVAVVIADGERHASEGEHEGLAVVKAFCAALVAMEPAQGALPLFDDGDGDGQEGGDDDAYPDPPAESFARPADGEDLPIGGEGEVDGELEVDPASEVPGTVEETATDPPSVAAG